MPHAICLVIDRLHAGLVGCYGNTWIHTPGLDRLAAESFVCDQALLTDPRLDRSYDHYWSAAAGPSLPEWLAQQGVRSWLITDEPRVAEHPLAAGFAERTLLESASSDSPTTAADASATGIARFLATAAEAATSLTEPTCLWLHMQALAAAWDAPYEYRAEYAEPEDPDPPEGAEVPNHFLPPDADPDELLGVQQAYAGQLTLLDECLMAFLEAFRAGSAAQDTLLIVTSARGFPLGEHGRVGQCDEALYSELAQLVCLVREPSGIGRLDRTQALVTPADLGSTLRDWFTGQRAAGLWPLMTGQAVERPQLVAMKSELDSALRTPAWHCRLPGGAMGAAVELYSKPGDRWEVVDVADRMPEIASTFQAMVDENGAFRPVGNMPLPSELVEIVD